MGNYFERDNPSTCDLLPLPRLRRLLGDVARFRGAFEEVATAQPIFDAALSRQLDQLVQVEEELAAWVRRRARTEAAA